MGCYTGCTGAWDVLFTSASPATTASQCAAKAILEGYSFYQIWADKYKLKVIR